MKKFLGLFAILLALVALIGCGKTDTPTPTPGDESLDGTYDITVWVSEISGVKELTQEQIKAFEAENPGIKINATVEGISEGESATQMITSVEDGADLYCFAQDQLARLVQAGALNKLGVTASQTVKDLNDAGSVGAATVNGSLYCYPLTSDNGYYMYYDKSVISEDILDSLEDIIAACESAHRAFSFNLEGSAWYNASFFFATGCKSEWTTDETGAFVSVDDTFNSAAGLVALKGMQKVLKSTAYVDSAAGADFGADTPSAVVISGTWELSTVKKILGENFGATDLPSFTVDGQTYHLGSFSGNKLMGVKPSTNAKKNAVLQKLALYLTGEKCQAERFEQFGWGPSNKVVQASEAVQSDEALAALAAQSAYAIPQGQIHGSWWDIGKTYATAAKAATTDQDLQDALDAYKKAIDGLFTMPVEEKEAFTVIGGMNGDGWKTDIEMEQKPAGTWWTKQPIQFAAGDEFKVRQGKSWDVAFGTDGNNFVVAEAGLFYVKFVYDKDAGTGVITLEKVNPNYGWTVIGTVNGDNWSKDLYMEPDAAGIWKTVESYEMAAGTEFKVRFGLSWDTSYGDGTSNFVVETAGTYYVVFDPTTTTVSLEPAA